MPTVKEIKAKYKELHDDLTASFYEKKRSVGVTAEEEAEFNTQHGKIWADMETELKTATDYIEPVPLRNFPAEIDELKARLAELEKK